MKLVKKLLVAIVLMSAVIVSVGSDVYAANDLTDIEAYQAVFDASYYAKNNPDVVIEYGTDANSLLMHYINYGIKEGRSASAKFNASAYRTRYADLNLLYGDNMVEYCRHYAQYGKKEGRDATMIKASELALINAKKASASTKTVNSTSDFTMLGTYSTKYNAKIPRANNVALASARINGVVIKPGELFSFSNTILPRTIENGYVVAPVYINKTVGQGVGGGICQVSSTLYACMLSAGVPAAERHPHSMPVSYLPEGMDATISGTSLDLKFINMYSKPMMITSVADNGTLTVTLWLKN